MTIKNFLIIIFLFNSIFLFSQEDKKPTKTNKESTFGIQYSPIFSSGMNNSDINFTEDNINFDIQLKKGFVFGMEARFDLYKRYSFQTGLNFIRRNYDINITVESSDKSIFKNNLGHNELRLIGYEIPMMGLVYVRLSKKIYMDNAFGLSFNFFPSNVKFYDLYINKYSFVNVSLMANLGFEYRTENYGYFYLGAAYQVHFKDMGRFEFSVPAKNYMSSFSGNYLVINLKYFFDPVETAKKKKLKKTG